MKKIAVILLAPGHQDGSEITEAVSARIALSEFGADISYFGFNENFPTPETSTPRNALRESQRLSRGETQPIQELNVNDYDALVIPGGSGLLKNLSTWFTEKEKFKMNPLFQDVVLKFHEQSKPIGAICIAPFLVAQVLKSHKPLITLGETSELIAVLPKFGIQHEKCPSQDYITDRDCKVLSTPAYMNDEATPFQVYTGIRLMVKEIVEMA